jgi:hypothetical protein
MPTKAEGVTARQRQSSAAKRATFELLKSKPRAEKEVTFVMNTSEGHNEVSLLFRAIGSVEYDRLLTKNPPTTEQRSEGATYNINTFAPSLLAAVCFEPEMSSSEWSEIWNSPDWNRGEIMQFFMSAVELCNQGLEIPFTVSG